MSDEGRLPPEDEERHLIVEGSLEPNELMEREVLALMEALVPPGTEFNVAVTKFAFLFQFGFAHTVHTYQKLMGEEAARKHVEATLMGMSVQIERVTGLKYGFTVRESE